MKPVRTWIIVADAKSAKIYENLGPGSGLSPKPELTMVAPKENPFADEQGRSFNSTSPMRHKHEPHFSNEGAFARSVSEVLEKEEAHHHFDRVILCASPEMLGQIRKYLNKATQDRVLSEIPKNLGNIPERDLPGHFEDVLAV